MLARRARKARKAKEIYQKSQRPNKQQFSHKTAISILTAQFAQH